MKVIIETSDIVEAKQLLKARDMTNFIFELVNNGWRKFKHTNYDYEPAWEQIHSLLEENNINIEDLTN